MSDQQLVWVGAKVPAPMAEALRERARREDRSVASEIRRALRERLGPEEDVEYARASWPGGASA